MGSLVPNQQISWTCMKKVPNTFNIACFYILIRQLAKNCSKSWTEISSEVLTNFSGVTVIYNRSFMLIANIYIN